MKKLAALLTVIFAVSVPLAGCNTMKGAGQDIQKGGQRHGDGEDHGEQFGKLLHGGTPSFG